MEMNFIHFPSVEFIQIQFLSGNFLLAKKIHNILNKYLLKPYFLFIRRELEATERSWVEIQDPKMGQKNKILIQDKPSRPCLTKNTLLWCNCCKMEFD